MNSPLSGGKRVYTVYNLYKHSFNVAESFYMERPQTHQEYRFVVMIQIGHRRLKTIYKPEIKGKLCTTETPQ